jgi:8-oxo-dGTP pyrophosphatase MutT (NUDIX family)
MTETQEELVEKLRLILSRNSPVIHGVISPKIPAAVLVPFCFKDGEWNLLFTKRTNGVAKHQGEISFPGGASEDEDLDLIDTAVREACEEIGICRDSIHVIGVMESVPTVSNYCVLPVVATVDWPSPLLINHSEVDNVIFMPVRWLKDDNNWHTEEMVFTDGISRPVIHYEDFNGEHLWGITARLAQKITVAL